MFYVITQIRSSQESAASRRMGYIQFRFAGNCIRFALRFLICKSGRTQNAAVISSQSETGRQSVRNTYSVTGESLLLYRT